MVCTEDFEIFFCRDDDDAVAFWGAWAQERGTFPFLYHFFTEFRMFMVKGMAAAKLHCAGLEDADLDLGLLIPVHQGAFGHVEVGGDAGEAPASGPQFDEAVPGIGRVHGWCNVHLRVTGRRRRPDTRPVEANCSTGFWCRGGGGGGDDASSCIRVPTRALHCRYMNEKSSEKC